MNVLMQSCRYFLFSMNKKIQVHFLGFEQSRAETTNIVSKKVMLLYQFFQEKKEANLTNICVQFQLKYTISIYAHFFDFRLCTYMDFRKWLVGVMWNCCIQSCAFKNHITPIAAEIRYCYCFLRHIVAVTCSKIGKVI